MPEHSAATPAYVPARATIPLLTLITQESLDQDYQHIAERRAVEGEPPPSRRPRLVATVVVGVFGLLVSIAAVQTSEQADVTSASRESLIEQITGQRARLVDLQEQIVDLRETNVAMETDLDKVDAAATAAELRRDRLAAQTGFGAVTGPGVEITVDDSPDGEAVRDEDLALLVDGLWNAGAEAISINGKRLTARSALRNSGVAINLNGPPPLSPPYVVSAIGDTNTLQANLLDSESGVSFTSVAESFGFPVTMQNVSDLSLPAAPARLARLRSAVALTAKDPTDEPKELAP